MGNKNIKKQKTLRPTTGKVREALFDILRMEIREASFLDLYAGTGAVGIDALKEGASETVFVEESKSSARKINGLIDKLHFGERAKVITKKVLSFIEWAELNGNTFDIIFMDPPYHSDEILNALSALGTSQILNDGGVVIAEHFAKRSLPDDLNDLRKVKDYNYGDTILSFYKK